MTTPTPPSTPPSTPMPLTWSAVAREYVRWIMPDFRPAARALCALLDVGPGDRVLDVACGPGTAAFAARELGAAEVTGVDYAEGMLAAARELAAGDPHCTFLLGNALELPVPDAAFDVALSSFGVVFAPEPVRAVREMARALVPHGRAGLLAWPRTGELGRYYDIAYRHIPMPPSPHDPHAWGDPAQAREWFGTAFDVALVQELAVPLEAATPEEAWHILRAGAGRIATGYRELDDAARGRLDAEMHAYFADHVGADGRVHWDRPALAVCGRKRG